MITIIISKKRATLMKRKLSGRPLHAIVSQAKRNRSRNSNSSGSDESNPSLKQRGKGSSISRSRQSHNKSRNRQDDWSGTTINFDSHMAEHNVEHKSKHRKIFILIVQGS